MAKYITSLLKKESVAERTMRFEFAKPEGFTYQAGQSIDLTLIDPQETDTDGNTRAFSLISKPSDATIAIATRIRDSAFKRNLAALPIGTAVAVRGPFGSFTLHEDATRPAVFLAGGIGITPFHSIITAALEKKLSHALYLFYANRRPEDAAFLSALAAHEKAASNIVIVPTMTAMSKSLQPWNGEEGYITAPLLGRYIPEGTAPVYYLAGPSKMLSALREVLTQMGVSDVDVKVEEFPGY